MWTSILLWGTPTLTLQKQALYFHTCWLPPFNSMSPSGQILYLKVSNWITVTHMRKVYSNLHLTEIVKTFSSGNLIVIFFISYRGKSLSISSFRYKLITFEISFAEQGGSKFLCDKNWNHMPYFEGLSGEELKLLYLPLTSSKSTRIWGRSHLGSLLPFSLFTRSQLIDT